MHFAEELISKCFHLFKLKTKLVEFALHLQIIRKRKQAVSLHSLYSLLR